MGIKRAAFINMGSRYAGLAIQLVYTAVLSRMLTPEDFGVVAIAQVFITFFSTFSDMGLGSAVIQKRDLGGVDFSRLFAFTCLVGLALAGLFSLAGWPISWVYGDARLVAVCAVLSASLLLNTVNTVPNAMLMREKRFVAIGVRQIVSALVASAAGVASAFLGAGLYAITVYSVVNSLVVFLWNYLPNRVPLRFSGMRGSVAKVFGYSAWVLGFDVVNYFSRNLDNLLVGYFFGTAELGNYSKAYQLMRYPQTYLTSVVTPVLHPMLADRQNDLGYIYSVFLKSVKVLSLIGVFISVACFFCADGIVEVLYGSQWGQAADCFRLLAVSVWSQMVCGTAGTMFQVLNRTREQFVRGLAIAAVIVASILCGVLLGSVEAVAACVGVAYYVAFATFLSFLVRKSFGRPVSSFLRELAPDAAIAALLSAFFWATGSLSLAGAALLFVRLALGALAFAALLVAFGQLGWLASVLPSGLRSRIPARLLR